MIRTAKSKMMESKKMKLILGKKKVQWSRKIHYEICKLNSRDHKTFLLIYRIAPVERELILRQKRDKIWTILSLK